MSLVPRKKILFVGPMVGQTPGYVTTQGLLISKLLKLDGHEVCAVSSYLSRVMRLLHIIWTIFIKKNLSIMVLDVFGGLSFIQEDIASFLGERLGYKIIMVVRGGALPQFMKRHPKWSERVLRRADKIICPSNYLKKVLDEYGFQNQVLPNMVSSKTMDFNLRGKIAPKLIWMRAFDHAWNPLMAVHVLKFVSEVFPQTSLVMAGKDKGLLEKCRVLANQLGVEKNIRFAGFLDPAQKKEEFTKADIFLNTNTIDNMPVAVIEAWAAGLPVVATNVGGIPDMIDHEQTGLLVPDNDSRAMADAVIRLIRESLLVQHLSAAGRKKAESFFWENIKPQWEAVFKELSA